MIYIWFKILFMRKNFLLCYLFLSFSFFGQIKLADVSVELKRSSDFHQLITQVNPETAEIFSFASDKEKFTGIKFNNAVFFSDSLSVKKPFNFRYIMGSGFTESNNPVCYWATEDLEKFIGIEFDFNSHTTKTIQYNINLKNQTVFADFSEKGILYFLTEKKESKSLQLISIQGHKVTTNELDFSKFTIDNQNLKKVTLLELLHQFGITKIDTKGFNSYVIGTNPIKYYLRNDTLVITLDNTTRKTQIFEINLKSYEIKESVFNQNNIPDIQQTNSLLFENYLVLLELNKEAFDIQILDYSNKNLVQEYQISENQPLPINTKFLTQTGNNSPRTIKNSKKFIKRIFYGDIGASLYNLNGSFIATFGASREIVRNSDIVLGVGLGLSSIATGTGFDSDFLGGNFINQNVFFDVRFNSNFKQIDNTTEPLFVDKIAQFISENRNVKYEHYFPYKDFYILSYYDKNTNEIILSKFTDGFDY